MAGLNGRQVARQARERRKGDRGEGSRDGERKEGRTFLNRNLFTQDPRQEADGHPRGTRGTHGPPLAAGEMTALENYRRLVKRHPSSWRLENQFSFKNCRWFIIHWRLDAQNSCKGLSSPSPAR